jgi:recombinational DNA repair protein RecR
MTASNAKNEETVSPALETRRDQAVCRVCGQPAEEDVCPTCADKIRAEALASATGEAPKARSKPGRRRAKARSAAGG